MPTTTLDALYQETRKLLAKIEIHLVRPEELTPEDSKLFWNVLGEVQERLELVELQKRVLWHILHLMKLKEEEYKLKNSQADFDILALQKQTSLKNSDVFAKFQEDRILEKMRIKQKDLGIKKSEVETLPEKIKLLKEQQEEYQKEINKLVAANNLILSRKPRTSEEEGFLKDNFQKMKDLENKKIVLSKEITLLEDLCNCNDKLKIARESHQAENLKLSKELQAVLEEQKRCVEDKALNEKELNEILFDYKNSAAMFHKHIAMYKEKKKEVELRSVHNNPLTTPADLFIPEIKSPKEDIENQIKNLNVQQSVYEELTLFIITLQLYKAKENVTEDFLMAMVDRIPLIRNMEYLSDHIFCYMQAIKKCKSEKLASKILSNYINKMPQCFLNPLSLDEIEPILLLNFSTMLVGLAKTLYHENNEIRIQFLRSLLALPKGICHSVLRHDKTQSSFDELLKEMDEFERPFIQKMDEGSAAVEEKILLVDSDGMPDISTTDLIKKIYRASLQLVCKYYGVTMGSTGEVDRNNEFWIARVNFLKEAMESLNLKGLKEDCEKALENFTVETEEKKRSIFKAVEKLIAHLIKSSLSIGEKEKLMLRFSANIVHRVAGFDIKFETSTLECDLNIYFNFFDDDINDYLLLQELYKIFSGIEFFMLYSPSRKRFFRRDRDCFSDNFNSVLTLRKEIISFAKLSSLNWHVYLKKVASLFEVLSYTGKGDNFIPDLIYSDRQNSYYWDTLKIAVLAFLKLNKFLMNNEVLDNKKTKILNQYRSIIEAYYEKVLAILLQKNPLNNFLENEVRELKSDYYFYSCEKFLTNVNPVVLEKPLDQVPSSKKKRKKKRKMPRPMEVAAETNAATVSEIQPVIDSQPMAENSVDTISDSPKNDDHEIPPVEVHSPVVENLLEIPPRTPRIRYYLPEIDLEPAKGVRFPDPIKGDEKYLLVKVEGNLGFYVKNSHKETYDNHKKQKVFTKPHDLILAYSNDGFEVLGPFLRFHENIFYEKITDLRITDNDEKCHNQLDEDSKGFPKKTTKLGNPLKLPFLPNKILDFLPVDLFIASAGNTLLQQIQFSSEEWKALSQVYSVFNRLEKALFCAYQTLRHEDSDYFQQVLQEYGPRAFFTTVSIKKVLTIFLWDNYRLYLSYHQENFPRYTARKNSLTPYEIENFSLSHLIENKNKTELERFLSFAYEKSPNLYEKILDHVMKYHSNKVLDTKAFLLLRGLSAALNSLEVSLLNSAVTYFFKDKLDRSNHYRLSVLLYSAATETLRMNVNLPMLTVNSTLKAKIGNILQSIHVPQAQISLFLSPIHNFKHQGIQLTADGSLKELTPNALFCIMNGYLETVHRPEQLFWENPLLGYEAVSCNAQGYRYHGNLNKNSKGLKPFSGYFFMERYRECNISWPMLKNKLTEHESLGHPFWRELWDSGVMQMLLFDSRVKVNVSDCFDYLLITAHNPEDNSGHHYNALFILAAMWAYISVKTWPLLYGRLPAFAQLPGFAGSSSEIAFVWNEYKVRRESGFQPLNQSSSTFFKRPALPEKPIAKEKDISLLPQYSQ